MCYPISADGFLRAARACALLIALAPAAMAQTPQLPGEPTQPAAAQPAAGQTGEPAPGAQDPTASPGTGWSTDTIPGKALLPHGAVDGQVLEAQPPIVLSPDQIAMLTRISAYLTGLVNIEGRFVQTDHRNEEQRGRFYVRRPGRLRFDYAAPSKLRIVSDGEYLSVEDHDLKTVDKFPLDATPIQLLLGKDVNLTRDAVILDMRQDDTAVVVTLRDKSGTAAGQLQLFFKLPELELYEWVITDAQGLDTRIELASMVTGNERSEKFFQASTIELDRLNSGFTNN